MISNESSLFSFFITEGRRLLNDISFFPSLLLSSGTAPVSVVVTTSPWPLSVFCGFQATFTNVYTEALCCDVAEVSQFLLLDGGYKFSFCTKLVQRRFIGSMIVL